MSKARSFVADIGGTNARFAIAETATSGAAYTLAHLQKVKAVDYPSLEDAVEAYFTDLPGARPERACIAVAATVSKTAEVRFTNSHWRIQPKSLMETSGVSRLEVVNDFVALARGVMGIEASGFHTVLPGEGLAAAPLVVLGPGTGLGMSMVQRDGRVKVMGTEGGHMAFSPRAEVEIEVYRQLHRDRGYVSFELLLSGRGLVNIHQAVCTLADAPLHHFEPADITAAALREADTYPTAKLTVDVFCAVLGTYAGNCVLTTGAQGGVVLGGGILPRIKDLLPYTDFGERFYERGPMSHYVKDVPVRLITADDVALHGAALWLDDVEAS